MIQDGILRPCEEASQATISTVRVAVTLLDILDDVDTDDRQANLLARTLNDTILPSSIPADRFIVHSECTSEEVDSIRHQVLRFLQTKDKYAALTSMLLKSRAFHLAQEFLLPGSKQIIDLPRTQYKKPYIPVTKEQRLRMRFQGEDQDIYPMSISHQHPFVGMAQLDPQTNLNRKKAIRLGIDIVVFEEYNARLYDSEDEFLEVFQDYFTHREWALIQSQQSEWRLQEFYIRWSMKEAYTKALGVGLGFDFSSFDLLLSGDRDGDVGGLPTGIFASIVGRGCTDIYTQAGYMEDLKGTMPRECWDFSFLPLCGKGSSSDKPRGSACVCVGPLPSAQKMKLQVSTQWTGLHSLIEWHQSSP